MLYTFEGKKPDIASDAYVSETAIVIGDVKIGSSCYIGHGAILRGDYGSISIGLGTAVEEGVIIHAPSNETSVIGKRVTLGHGAIIHSSKIGDFSVIGMGAVLSIRSEIGTNTIIAEGAIVKLKQILPDGVVAGGNPAKLIRKVAQQDIDYWQWGKELYIDLAKKYLAGAMEKL